MDPDEDAAYLDEVRADHRADLDLVLAEVPEEYRDDLADILVDYRKGRVDVLGDLAQDAALFGGVLAYSMMDDPIDDPTLIETAEVWAEDYKSDLIKRGGSYINRQFVPWLETADRAVRTKVATILDTAIREGASRADVTRQLSDYFDTHSHAAMVADTEISRIQNEFSLDTYESEGTHFVQVSDGGGPNSCDICEAVNGEVWTVEEARSRVLEHPNCWRTFYPVEAADVLRPEVPEPEPEPEPEPVVEPQEPLERYTAEERKEALAEYQDNGYAPINNYLRGLKTTDEDVEYAERMIPKLDEVMNMANERSYYVYRADGGGVAEMLFERTGIAADMKGVRLQTYDDLHRTKAPTGQSWNDYFKEKLTGVTFVDKGFVSTSTSQDLVKERFLAPHSISEHGAVGLVRIQGKGKAIMVQDFTGVDTESELLLPRGQEYRINSVQITPHLDGRREKLYLVYNVEVI